MSAINDTTCPKCGGRAYWCSDDGVTRCDDSRSACNYQGVEEHRSGYRPPWHRGGGDFGRPPSG